MKPRTPLAQGRYVVPRYRAPEDVAFYHVLHGTVPGHEIDFIYGPEVPQGLLNRTHLAHVARLVKYIEPRERAPLAFAIGNLSRDDVQHEPGHGGLVLLAGLRVEGVVDHASRALPPFAHGIVAIDRAFDRASLVATARAFLERLEDEEGRAAGGFYREYVCRMRSDPHRVEALLAGHVASFADLPAPGRSALDADFLARADAPPPERVTIVHPDGAPFEALVSVAAAIGSVLYRSDIKWTAISSGRELDIPGGTFVRLVPESEAPREERGLVVPLGSVPRDDAGIAESLFSAAPRRTTGGLRGTWRARLAEKGAASTARDPSRLDVSIPTEGPAGAALEDAPRPMEEPDRRPRGRGFWAAGLIGGVLSVAALLGTGGPAKTPTAEIGGGAQTPPRRPTSSLVPPPPRGEPPSFPTTTTPPGPATTAPGASSAPEASHAAEASVPHHGGSPSPERTAMLPVGPSAASTRASQVPHPPRERRPGDPMKGARKPPPGTPPKGTTDTRVTPETPRDDESSPPSVFEDGYEDRGHDVPR